jgi:hypothetical protein
MELASFLAGERWSDRPRCTHPLLSALARAVNDHTSDDGRSRLAGLIPSVIGLTGDDLRIDARIALRSALVALPVVSEERQRVMAICVLSADNVLARLDGRPTNQLEDASQEALDSVPDAARWARQFSREVGCSLNGFRRYGAPSAIRCAVPAVAVACVRDPDVLLYDMLARSIDDCVPLASGSLRTVADGQLWAGVPSPTAART